MKKIPTLGKYILDKDHNVIPVHDLLEWAKWFEHERPKQRIGYSDLGEYCVSTVFLGIDHSFEIGPPLLFETMIFMKDNAYVKGEKNIFLDYQERYSTWNEAKEGHKRACEHVLQECEKNKVQQRNRNLETIQLQIKEGERPCDLA